MNINESDLSEYQNYGSGTSAVNYNRPFPKDTKNIDVSRIGMKTDTPNDWNQIETLKHGLHEVVSTPGIYTMKELYKGMD